MKKILFFLLSFNIVFGVALDTYFGPAASVQVAQARAMAKIEYVKIKLKLAVEETRKLAQAAGGANSPAPLNHELQKQNNVIQQINFELKKRTELLEKKREILNRMHLDKGLHK